MWWWGPTGQEQGKAGTSASKTHSSLSDTAFWKPRTFKAEVLAGPKQTTWVDFTLLTYFVKLVVVGRGGILTLGIISHLLLTRPCK